MHTFIIAFEEKALSLMSRTNRPIISFTKLDSKKVNKLCQVYLMMSGRSDFAGHLHYGKVEQIRKAQLIAIYIFFRYI